MPPGNHTKITDLSFSFRPAAFAIVSARSVSASDQPVSAREPMLRKLRRETGPQQECGEVEGMNADITPAV
jgi:hypothetical protein